MLAAIAVSPQRVLYEARFSTAWSVFGPIGFPRGALGECLISAVQTPMGDCVRAGGLRGSGFLCLFVL